MKKAALLLLIAAVVGSYFYFDLGDYLTLDALKRNRARLEDLRAANAILFAAVFVTVYVVQTAFSLPGAAILSLASGAIFGVAEGTLYVVTGATAGAVLAFLVSRTLLRPGFKKCVDGEGSICVVGSSGAGAAGRFASSS